jgi:hypothetical protein
MNPDGKTSKRFAHLLLWIACAGPVIWIAWANYSICLWWMTPSSPNNTHIMEWTEHGRIHYLTAGQYSFYSHFQTAAFIGLAAFFVFVITGALILRRHEKCF